MSTLFVNTIKPQSGDSVTISGSFIVSGTITSNKFVSQTIDTMSGSTVFGNDIADSHLFNGTLSGSSTATFGSSITAGSSVSGSGEGTFVGGVTTPGALKVTGSSTLAGAVNTQALTVEGALITESTTALGGATTATSISGSGLAEFAGGLRTAGTLNVSGNTNFSTVSGIASFATRPGGVSGGPASIFTGSIYQTVMGGFFETDAHVSSSGAATFGGNLATVGALNVSGAATVVGNVSGSSLGHFGSMVTSGPLSVTGAFTAPGIASGTLAGPASYLGINSSGLVVLTNITDAGAAVSAVANGADNRITTFSSADALNGEANLTFDGTQLKLTGNVSGSTTAQFLNGSYRGTLGVTGSTTLYGNLTAANQKFQVSSASGLSMAGNSIFYGNVSGSAGAQFVTSTILGSTLEVSGAASFAGNATVGDDLSLNSDSAVLKFGAGDDVTFTHDGGTGMDIVSAGALDISSGGGGVSMTVVDGQTVTLGKASAASLVLAPHGTAGSELITMNNNAGTTDGSAGAGAILLSASAGGLGLRWADGKDLWAEGGRAVITANEDAASCIKFHADAGTAQTIQILNDAGTVDGTAGAGAIDIEATAGGISLLWNDAKDLWMEGGKAVITANENGSEAIKLHADAGAAQTIQVINDAGTVDGTAGAGAIDIEATAGGISLLWNDGKDLWAEGGRAVITANEDAADCIKLHADAGTSQTINVLNDAGTSTAAIALTSTAGGITLSAGAISQVHDFATTAPLSIGSFDADGDYGGTVIKYSPGADDTLTVGGLYFLHTDGTWNACDADAVATGATQLLGIGLGNARSAGVLIKGFIRIPSTEILNVPGSNATPGLPLYVSTTASHIDFTAPSASDDFVRIVGYAIQDSTDVLIYFDPDNTYVEIS